MVSRVTGGRVTFLRGGEAGSAHTVSHLREQLVGALSDHAHSGSEAILKVGGLLLTFLGCVRVEPTRERRKRSGLLGYREGVY